METIKKRLDIYESNIESLLMVRDMQLFMKVSVEFLPTKETNDKIQAISDEKDREFSLYKATVAHYIKMMEESIYKNEMKLLIRREEEESEMKLLAFKNVCLSLESTAYLMIKKSESEIEITFY